MPFLEVIYTRPKPVEADKRRAFAQEAAAIFREVLSTPSGRLQIAIQHLQPDEGTELLTIDAESNHDEDPR